MFKKNIIKISLSMLMLSTAFLNIIAMKNEEKNLINTSNHKKINFSVQNTRKNLDKLFKSNNESKALNDYYNYFDRKLKKIYKTCEKITKISCTYRIDKEKEYDKKEIPSLEDIIIEHMEEAEDMSIDVDHPDIAEIEYKNELHQKEVFDIDLNISKLEIHVGKLLDNIYLINQKYKEFLNFVENIKDKKLLNLNFVEDSYRNKILSNNYIYMKSVFDIEKMVDKLKSYITEILNYIKTGIGKRIELNKNLSKILNNYNIKETKKLSVPEKLKTGINIMKELIYFMVKLVEGEVVKTIQYRILELAINEKYYY